MSQSEQLNSYERECLRIYNGDTTDLVEGMAHIELIIEVERSKAAHSLAELVSKRLRAEGYLVIRDIEDSLAAFHDTEVLGEQS